ncbi:unnamed protein product [Moneuplotes crassus]|uniref:C2H2-type domain-containing protein n=1 Tax=Euplotes crassus TaxID=5936 RepID=A0AAD1U2W4_EUPCR|nr:unnamed protein product [Moneuplotes crassus]
MSDDYRCPYVECAKQFASKKNLKDHIRTHTGEKPYICTHCGKGFAQYSTLHKHYRVHDKKRPYACRFDGCGKSFTQISNRIRHERIHTGEKPFGCAICEKRFCSSSNLHQHMKVHEKQNKKKKLDMKKLQTSKMTKTFQKSENLMHGGIESMYKPLNAIQDLTSIPKIFPATPKQEMGIEDYCLCDINSFLHTILPPKAPVCLLPEPMSPFTFGQAFSG